MIEVQLPSVAQEPLTEPFHVVAAKADEESAKAESVAMVLASAKRAEIPWRDVAEGLRGVFIRKDI